MNAERWRRIEALFNEALDFLPEERSAFFDRTCRDVELRAEVEAMLVSDAAPPSIFEKSRAPFSALLDSVPDLSPDVGHAGKRVGPYRVIREIGHGGMGRVYLAKREDVGKEVGLSSCYAVGLPPPTRFRAFFSSGAYWPSMNTQTLPGS